MLKLGLELLDLVCLFGLNPFEREYFLLHFGHFPLLKRKSFIKCPEFVFEVDVLKSQLFIDIILSFKLFLLRFILNF